MGAPRIPTPQQEDTKLENALILIHRETEVSNAEQSESNVTLSSFPMMTPRNYPPIIIPLKVNALKKQEPEAEGLLLLLLLRSGQLATTKAVNTTGEGGVDSSALVTLDRCALNRPHWDTLRLRLCHTGLITHHGRCALDLTR